MVRTQIQLNVQQARALKELAAARGISMAELIRQSVDQFLQAATEPPRQQRVQKLKEAAGKYRAGAAALAENHDAYLDEIYGDDPA